MIKRVRHILILVFLLSGALKALAVYTMPDRVCVGTTRQYGVDGMTGSTYTWMVNKVIQPSSTNTMEITWTTSGIFTVEVQEHNENCNGDIQSGEVTVVGIPILDVPKDTIVCASYILPPITGTNLSGNEAYYDNTQAAGGKKISGAITQSQVVWVYDESSTQPNCFDEISFNVTIIKPVAPAFNPIAAICSGSQVITLPTLSLNNITGTWLPTFDNTVTTTYTFTPDAGQCATTDTLTVKVNQPIKPVFNAIASICSGSPAINLPATSLNNITGSWTPAFDNTITTTYTFTPDAGQCATTANLTVVINQPVIPAFNPVASICSGSPAITLPTTSLNNITGSWSPAFDNTTTTTYTFTPNAGQCATKDTLTVVINQPITPAFNPIGHLCLNSVAPGFPLTSTDGITGTWSPATISTATEGTNIYTFTPDGGQCANPTTMSITIDPLITPLFLPITPLCLNGSAPVLSTTSINGITGTWSPAIISTATVGTVDYTFTPDGVFCASPVTLAVITDQVIAPLFDPIGSLCLNSVAPLLPTISTNGITGTWSPSTISTATEGTVSLTFTPDGGHCYEPTTMDVIIDPLITPLFDLIGPLCMNSIAPVLPLQSTNGISGTWNPAIISTSDSSKVTYTFTPNTGQCAVTTSMVISINPQMIPKFDPIGPLCLNSTAPILQTTSINGISGTWSPAIISTATAGNVDYLFTPNAGECANPATMTITINPLVDPVFNAIGPLCLNAVAPVLPTTSTNGITGTWNPAIVATSAAGTIAYVFSPDKGTCGNPVTLDILIDPQISPDFDPIGPLCINSIAPVLPATSKNGIAGNWQPATISTLTEGTVSYTFVPAGGMCNDPKTIDITVNSLTIPQFNSFGPLCLNSIVPDLPLTSINGISGTWSPATISTNAEGTVNYSFTPNDGQCASVVTQAISIIPQIMPQFDPIGFLCPNSVPPVLPTTSKNGITGSWSPSVISTNQNGSSRYIFTPDAGQCANSLPVDIIVTPSLLPVFDPIGIVCINSIAPILPTKSINSITGSWNPSTISTTTEGTTTYTFTPDAGQCAIPVTIGITVSSPVIPTFAQIGPLGLNSVAQILPTESIDKISGTWNPSVVSTATTGETAYIFTPNAGQCAKPDTMKIMVYKITIAITVDPINCPGNLTQIHLSASGGIGPYLYEGNNSGDFTVSANPVNPYRYTVEDVGGNYFVFTQDIMVTDPIPMNAKVDFTPITCTAKADASITVTNPTGGSKIYQVRIDGGAWNRVPNKIWTFTNLGPGIYPVQIRDASYVEDCIVTLDTINIRLPAIPDAPAWSGNGELTDCQNPPYPGLDANMALASEPNNISITWYNDLGQVVASPRLNTVGSITYYAEANNGTCVSATRTPVKLTIHTPIPEDLVSTGDLTGCEGDPVPLDARTAIIPPSGNETIVWTDETGASTLSPILSTVGTKTYYAVASNGFCTSLKNTPVTLTIKQAPAAPAYSVTVLPTCAVPIGTIVVTTPPEGTGFEYSIDGGQFVSSATFNQLIPGLHQISVRELATGCKSAVTSLIVNPVSDLPTAPIVSVSNQPTCSNPTGSILLSGLPAGNWTINPGSIAGTGDTLTISGLIANKYNFTVTNAVGCASGKSADIVINEPPALLLIEVLSPTNPLSCGGTGTLNLKFTNIPDGTYTIKSDEVSFNGVIVASGLASVTAKAGTYHNLQITANSCTSAMGVNASLSDPSAPPAPIVGIITQPDCITATGSVVLTGLPDTGTWTINPGGITGTGTSDTIKSLAAGKTYHFSVTNAAGCSSLASGDVVIDKQPATPILVIGKSSSPASCNGDGSIVLKFTNVTDGTYSITYDGGIFNGVIVSKGTATIPAKQGTYSNLQIMANTCNSALGVNISLVDPLAPAAPIIGKITPPDCKTATGNVVLSGLPSTGTWTINPGGITGTGTSKTISGLAADATYNFLVTNSNGCTSAASNDVVIIPQPQTPSVPLVGAIVQPTCSKATGSVFLSGLPTGNWIINPGKIAGTGDTLTISGLVAAKYNYTVTNAAGCVSSATGDVVINIQPLTPATPLVEVTQNPKCNNPDGTVAITQPLSPDYEYSNDGGLNYQASPVFPGLKTNVYIFRVRNKSTLCVSDTTWKSVPAIPPAPTMLIPVDSIKSCQCYNGKGSFNITFTGVPDGIYTISYDNGQFDNVNVANLKATVPASAGTYTNLTINANGCISDKYPAVTIIQPDSISIVPSITQIDLKSQTKGSINLAVTGGTPDYQYLWKADASIGFAGATGSMISNLNNGIYKVTVTDANGCQMAKTIVLPPPDYPPVAVNDEFTVSCNGVSGNLLLNDTDPEHEKILLWMTLVRNPSHGTITLNPNQSGAFEYVVDPNYSGIDTFRYVITDTKQNMSNAALVTIHIVPDFDGDGIPDDIDQDADGDGILNVDEVLPGQDWKTEDSDGDGHPNWLDIDSDNDGIVDNIEAQSTKDYIPPTGIVNQYGVDYAYDPAHGGKRLIPVDTDGDGIPDFLDTDSDNDGVPDYIEGNDANHDGHPDFELTGKDSDGDGLDDAFDTVDKCASPATNMLGSRSPLQDTDGDGIPDWRDDNDDGDKWPTRMEDWNGDGIWWNDDSNHNGIPDYLDPLSDCELFIPDAFSPNGDNIHDYFNIFCLENYTNATMYIFDQLGNKLYEKAHYGNLEVWKTFDKAWWDGRTTNRSIPTAPDGRVAPGTYFYVLQLGNGEVRKSYVFVSY